MMVRRLALIFLIVAGIGLFAWEAAMKRSIPRHSEEATPPTEAIAEETTAPDQRRLGPFPVDGRNYSIVLHESPRKAGSTEETGNTVTLMEILDSRGDVQYSRSFSSAENDAFSDAWSVSAQLYSGATGSGLLVTYQLDSEPSAPTPEEDVWWQLFGVVAGKLVPFSGPVSTQGSLLTKSKSDVLEFKVWAHHFRLIFPVTVNWSTGKLSPAAQCDACEYKVHPEDLSARQDLTFVELCASPQSDCKAPQRILVKKDSAIDFLAARADVHWSEGSTAAPSPGSSDSMSDQGEISVGDDVWLKIRIDGKEGWLHHDEDFLALSFPFEQ